MAQKIQGATTFNYYKPQEINANTQIVVFFDGSPGNSSNFFKSWFNSNNPDFIIVRAPAAANVSDTYDFVSWLQSENGINPSSTIHSASFSAGSKKHLRFVRYQAKRNPASVPSNITLFDPYGVDGAKTLLHVLK